MPLTTRVGLQGLRAPGPSGINEGSQSSSHGLRLLFRGCPSTEPLPVTSSSSLEVFSPSASSSPEAAARLARLRVSRPPSAFRFSQPLDASSAPSLPALFHAGSALGVYPPELCSSRAAVRCSQRLSPHGVRDVFRVLLRARVRQSVQLFKLKAERVALLGLFPSRVLTLSALARPSPRLPSCGCLLGRARPNGLHFRVSRAESTARLSRDRRPS